MVKSIVQDIEDATDAIMGENCETPWLRLLSLLGDEYRQNISEVHLLSLADESYPGHFYSASSATKEFRNFLIMDILDQVYEKTDGMLEVMGWKTSYLENQL